MWGISDSWLEHTGMVVNDVGLALKYHLTVDYYVSSFLLFVEITVCSMFAGTYCSFDNKIAITHSS